METTFDLAQLEQLYKQHCLLNDTLPSNPVQLLNGTDLTEAEFYALTPSIQHLEKGIWKGYATATIARLDDSADYKEYNSRERLLAFYFTLIEELQKDRSYTHFRLSKLKSDWQLPHCLKSMDDAFTVYVKQLIEFGQNNNEIQARPIIDKVYDKGFRAQLLYVMRIWHKDESEDGSKTDAAIEKSVHLAFDLLAKGALDSLIDFAKFAYQNKAF